MKSALITLIPALFLVGCWHGYAETPVPPGPSHGIDPPGRVARISYATGPVSLRAAGTDAWAAAELNRPLTTGDELWTSGRAASADGAGLMVL